MADIKISQLPELFNAADSDSLVINDLSAGATKRILVGNLLDGFPTNLVDSASGSVAQGDLKVLNELSVGGDATLTNVLFSGSLVDTIAGITSSGLTNSITASNQEIPTAQAVVDYVDANNTSVRGTIAGTASALGNGDSANLDISGSKTYALLKVTTNHASRICVYASDSARSADIGRGFGTAFTDSSGVIVDINTNGPETILVSPGVIGYNANNNLSLVYAKVQNTSGGTEDVTLTLTTLKLED